MPTKRAPGSWPGDRPIRWGGVAGGLAWLAVGWLALLSQLALAIPTVVVAGAVSARVHPLAGVVIALGWGAGTLFAAWSFLFGRWRIVLAPIVTALVLVALAGDPR